VSKENHSKIFVQPDFLLLKLCLGLLVITTSCTAHPGRVQSKFPAW